MGSWFCALLVLSTLGVMYVETHKKLVCLGLLNVNARATKANKMEGLYVFRDAGGLCLSRAAECERTGDQGQAGWGTCIHFKTSGDLVSVL